VSNAPFPRVIEVDLGELRRQFIIGHFEERAQLGELTVRLMPGSEHSAPTALGEPKGTVSHMLQYFEPDGTLVAKVHEYLRPDGTIAASGKRDPKWLRIGNTVYKQRRTRLGV
jgi:hypothetical protein